MRLNKAIEEKITKLLIERNIPVNKLASMSYLTQSTVDSLINGKSKILNYLLLFVFVMDWELF